MAYIHNRVRVTDYSNSINNMADSKPWCDSVANKLNLPSLKDFQKDAIQYVLDTNDVFVCTPTGSGKSVCFLMG